MSTTTHTSDEAVVQQPLPVGIWLSRQKMYAIAVVLCACQVLAVAGGYYMLTLSGRLQASVLTMVGASSRTRVVNALTYAQQAGFDDAAKTVGFDTMTELLTSKPTLKETQDELRKEYLHQVNTFGDAFLVVLAAWSVLCIFAIWMIFSSLRTKRNSQ